MNRMTSTAKHTHNHTHTHSGTDPDTPATHTSVTGGHWGEKRETKLP